MSTAKKNNKPTTEELQQELQNLIGAPEYETVVVTLERKLMRAIAENRCLKPSLTQMPTPRFGQEFSRIGAAE